jgi:hypothetical protein
MYYDKPVNFIKLFVILHSKMVYLLFIFFYCYILKLKIICKNYLYINY